MTNNRPIPPNRPVAPVRPNSPQRRNDARNQPSNRNQPRPQREQSTQSPGSRQFHNPYNFVPAIPRQNITGELGDRTPSGHGNYLSDHWSGRIRVTLTTVTPLLIPDASLAEEWQGSKHKTYPLRLVNGQPYLPPTSIKGSLRSAYEIVTNSRLSIFRGHDEKLGFSR